MGRHVLHPVHVVVVHILVFKRQRCVQERIVRVANVLRWDKTARENGAGGGVAMAVKCTATFASTGYAWRAHQQRQRSHPNVEHEVVVVQDPVKLVPGGDGIAVGAIPEVSEQCLVSQSTPKPDRREGVRNKQQRHQPQPKQPRLPAVAASTTTAAATRAATAAAASERRLREGVQVEGRTTLKARTSGPAAVVKDSWEEKPPAASPTM